MCFINYKVALFGLILFIRSLYAHSEPSLDFSYHNYKSLTKYLKDFEKVHSNVAELYSVGKSRRGNELWVMKLSTAKSDAKNIANIKLIGNIHGNEAVGREVLLHFIGYLALNHKTDPKIAHLLEHNRVHIMPSMNPDGFEMSSEGCATDKGRENFREVDLNRNFPDCFHNNKIPIQPETQAVIDWMNKTYFILSASLHGGAMVANYPFDVVKQELSFPETQESPTEDDDVFRYLALTYSRAHPTMHKGIKCNNRDKHFTDGITNGAQWYSLQGGMQDYNYGFHGCMELTLEISCCKYPPKDKLEGLWNENKNALLEYCLKAGMGVKGTILDKTTKNPIPKVKLMIEGRNVTFNTKNDGEFYRILKPGYYKIKVSAENYKSIIRDFQVDEANGTNPTMTTIEIVMTPGNSAEVEYISMTTLKSDIYESTETYNTPRITTKETDTMAPRYFIDNQLPMVSKHKIKWNGTGKMSSDRFLMIFGVFIIKMWKIIF